MKSLQSAGVKMCVWAVFRTRVLDVLETRMFLQPPEIVKKISVNFPVEMNPMFQCYGNLSRDEYDVG